MICDVCIGFICVVSQYERQQREKMELEESRKQAMVAMAMVGCYSAVHVNDACCQHVMLLCCFDSVFIHLLCIVHCLMPSIKTP